MWINCFKKLKNQVIGSSVRLNKYPDLMNFEALFCKCYGVYDMNSINVWLSNNHVDTLFRDRTPLSTICSQNLSNVCDLARLLIERGADVNNGGQFKNCSTPIDYCVNKYNGNAQLLELLLSVNTVPDLTKYGLLLFNLALHDKHDSMLVMLKYGARTDIMVGAAGNRALLSVYFEKQGVRGENLNPFDLHAVVAPGIRSAVKQKTINILRFGYSGYLSHKSMLENKIELERQKVIEAQRQIEEGKRIEFERRRLIEVQKREEEEKRVEIETQKRIDEEKRMEIEMQAVRERMREMREKMRDDEMKSEEVQRKLEIERKKMMEKQMMIEQSQKEIDDKKKEVMIEKEKISVEEQIMVNEVNLEREKKLLEMIQVLYQKTVMLENAIEYQQGLINKCDLEV